MANSYVAYTSVAPATTNLNVPFSYLDPDQVAVYIDDVLQTKVTHWDFTTPTNIALVTPTSGGEDITIKRETDIDAAAVSFSPAMLVSDDLNTSHLQNFYLHQEIIDDAALGDLPVAQEGIVWETGTDGYALTSDGAGNAAWEAIPSSATGFDPTSNQDITGNWSFFTEAVSDFTFKSTSYNWDIFIDDSGLFQGGLFIKGRDTAVNEYGIILDGGGYVMNYTPAGLYTIADPSGYAAEGDTIDCAWDQVTEEYTTLSQIGFYGDSTFQFGSNVLDGDFTFYVKQTGSATNWKYPFYVDAGAQDVWIQAGYDFKVGYQNNATESVGYSARPTNYVDHSHDNTSFNVTGVNTLNYNFLGLSGNVQVGDGAGLWVFDAGNTDAISFSHDGIDANILGTLSNDLNITGFTNVDISGNIVVSGTVDGVDVAALNTTVADLPVANLADGTDGELITWSAAGAPTTVAVGTSGHVLTSNGAGAAPTFQAAGGGGGFNSGIVTVHEGATLSTYSNQPSSGNWWQGNNRYRYKMDLSDATSIRLILQVSVASASVNTPVAQVRYATSLPVNYAATSPIGSGATECEVSLATGSIIVDSGWITLTAAAAVDNVYLAFCGLGGDATADPAVANTLIMWK